MVERRPRQPLVLVTRDMPEQEKHRYFSAILVEMQGSMIQLTSDGRVYVDRQLVLIDEFSQDLK